ncbi:signal recognition particle protein [Salix suchowensis]|nr:signal recognition particle protein [Salix suchowensis]
MDGGVPNIKKWVVVYPVYINSKKTIAEGRRISVEKGCENPTCIEIGDCCSHLKLPFAIEIDKAYPRDFMQVGRVRVLLKREDGSLCNPAIPSRKQLMLHVAELVPRHPGGPRSRSRHPHQMLQHPSLGRVGRRKDSLFMREYQV